MQKMLATIQHQQLEFKLAEVAVYARDTDFLLAWTGVMKSRSKVRRMFHLPEKSVDDHILAGWCGRIGEMKKMVKMKESDNTNDLF